MNLNFAFNTSSSPSIMCCFFLFKSKYIKIHCESNTIPSSSSCWCWFIWIHRQRLLLGNARISERKKKHLRIEWHAKFLSMKNETRFAKKNHLKVLVLCACRNYGICQASWVFCINLNINCDQFHWLSISFWLKERKLNPLLIMGWSDGVSLCFCFSLTNIWGIINASKESGWR